MQELLLDFIIALLAIVFKGQEVDAILVIINKYTKYAILFPVSCNIIVIELVILFYNKVELYYSAPCGLILNQGSLFISAF